MPLKGCRQCAHRLSKGNQVKIPEPGVGYLSERGDTNELRYASGGPEKSSLFFLTVANIMTLESDYLEIGSNDWKSILSFEMFGAPSMALENRREVIILELGRTHHRIRSPR